MGISQFCRSGLLTEKEFLSYYVKAFVDCPFEDALMVVVQYTRTSVANLYQFQHIIRILSAVEKEHLRKTLTLSISNLLDNGLCFNFIISVFIFFNVRGNVSYGSQVLSSAFYKQARKWSYKISICQISRILCVLNFHTWFCKFRMLCITLLGNS